MADDIRYDTAVRGFDHMHLASHPSYPKLREALNDLATEVANLGGTSLSDFLTGARDMVLTTPYADTCNTCRNSAMYWPMAAKRDGDSITGIYRCSNGHTWTCGYDVRLPGWMA
jgi:DNA-directed RNA polymerase subunit M/transcription elongation factor TFIIS